jgi:hypothetical protein
MKMFWPIALLTLTSGLSFGQSTTQPAGATPATTTTTTTTPAPDTVRCEAVDPYGTYMEVIVWPADLVINLVDNQLLTPDLLKQPYTVQIAKASVANRKDWYALPVERRGGFIRFGHNMPVARVKASCVQALWDSTRSPK